MAPGSPFSVFVGLLAAHHVLATSYPLIESWYGKGFMEGFDYPASTYDNTTNGDVFWATPQNTSLIYTSSSGTVILKVDNISSVVYNEKRYAPKVLSKTAYDPGTVWVLDAVHIPYGCSVWPAFWTQGALWPAGGEIDIVEGINMETTNQIALHAQGADCIASTNATITGDLTYTNCSTAAGSDSGCTVNDTATNSYGPGFAAAGGGVYACEFSTSAIRMWFWTRSDIPSNLSVGASTVDTSTFGTPVAQYDASTCNFAQYFGPQTLTIDTTLCGTYAGVPSLLEETCPPLVGTNTCYTTYVINEQEATYANAYWEINYVNVYSTSTKSAVSGSTGNATSTITAGVGATSGAGTASAKSGGAGRILPSALDGKAEWAVLLLGGFGAGLGLLL